MESVLCAGPASPNEQSCVAANPQPPLNRLWRSLGWAAGGHYRPQSDEGTPDLVRSKPAHGALSMRPIDCHFAPLGYLTAHGGSEKQLKLRWAKSGG